MVLRRAGFPAVVGMAVPSEVLQVEIGDTVRVTSQFTYIGPAVTGKLYVAIGNDGALGFDEILKNEKAISVPETATPKVYEDFVDIAITSAIAGGKYDMYSKIREIPGADILSAVLQDVIEVVAAAPEFSNLQITSYVKR